jgi:hypothetical protein
VLKCEIEYVDFTESVVSACKNQITVILFIFGDVSKHITLDKCGAMVGVLA